VGGGRREYHIPACHKSCRNANAGSRRTFQDKLARSDPSRGPERPATPDDLKHRPTFAFTVQAGTPLHRSTTEQRVIRNSTDYPRGALQVLRCNAPREPPTIRPTTNALSRPGPARQAVRKKKGLHTGRYDLVRIRAPGTATNRGGQPDYNLDSSEDLRDFRHRAWQIIRGVERRA